MALSLIEDIVLKSIESNKTMIIVKNNSFKIFIHKYIFLYNSSNLLKSISRLMIEI